MRILFLMIMLFFMSKRKEVCVLIFKNYYYCFICKIQWLIVILWVVSAEIQRAKGYM